ncbi:MAG: PAS domain-containing protein [Anaerolineae bacterium]|nr:PAS domain-containing protein [Anaerolineae bacterium]
MRKIFRWNDWPLIVKLIVALTLVADLSIAAVNTPIQRITRANIERDTQTNLLNLAELEGQRIGQGLSAQVNLLETALTDNDTAQDAVAEQNTAYEGTQQEIIDSILDLDAEWRNQPDESNALIASILNNDLSDQLEEFIEQNPAHLEVFITDRYGATIASTGVLSDYYQADEDWWQAAWNDGAGGVYISEAVYDESTQALVLEFSVPILDEGSNEVSGVLKSAYSLAALSSQVSQFTLGETGHAHLFDGDGNLLAASDVPVEQSGQRSEEALLLDGKIFEGAGSALSVEAENKSYLVGYAPVVNVEQPESVINDLNWVFMVLQTEDEALAALRFRQRLGLGITLGVSLLATVAAILISRSLIRGINEFEKVFRAAAIGNFDARAKVYGTDEIGRAADAINHMLEQFTSLLERISKTSQQRFDDFAAFGEAWELDAEGRYVFTSESFAETLGYEATEMLGRHAAEFVREDNVAVVGAEIERSTRELTPTQDVEVIYQTKDGQDLNILVSGRTVIDENGKVTGYRGIHKNITERRQAEIALRENQALLSLMIEQIPDWIFVKDTEYRYILANEAFANGFANMRVEEIIGKTDYEIGIPVEFIEGNPAIGSPGVASSDRAAVEEGRVTFEPENIYPMPDGTVHIFEAVKMPFRDADGNIIGVMSVIRDITEQRQVVHDVEAAAEQVTEASESMFDIVQLLLDQATVTAEMAAEATRDAEIGDEAVTNTITAMGQIRENTQESARRIKRLGEAAQEITEAIRLIEEIADRTTVLALNASIQAAAAGEAGRGFAVVAEEVQRLAERATGATRQIEETVKSIQAGTNEAVFSIEEATREVVGGSELAKETGTAMVRLNAAVGELAKLVQHMAETTASQTSESLGTLANLSQELQKSVSGFKVQDTERNVLAASGNNKGVSVPAAAGNRS